jgi:hypothetical protein
MADIQKTLMAHVKAQSEAQRWVEKAVEFREAGNERKAKECEEKAKVWLLKKMKLEARVKKSPYDPT